MSEKRYTDRFGQSAGESWGGPVEVPEVVLTGDGEPIRRAMLVYGYRNSDTFSKPEELGLVIQSRVVDDNECFALIGGQYTERIQVRLIPILGEPECDPYSEPRYLFKTREAAERSLQGRRTAPFAR